MCLYKYLCVNFSSSTVEPLIFSDWKNYVSDMFKKWLLFHIYWLNRGIKMLVVHFEDLRSNQEQQLRRVMRFLNRTLTDKVLNCVLQHPGKFRPHKYNVDNPYETIDKSSH